MKTTEQSLSYCCFSIFQNTKFGIVNKFELSFESDFQLRRKLSSNGFGFALLRFVID